MHIANKYNLQDVVKFNADGYTGYGRIIQINVWALKSHGMVYSIQYTIEVHSTRVRAWESDIIERLRKEA